MPLNMEDPLISYVYDTAKSLYSGVSHDFSHAVRVAEYCRMIAPSMKADVRVCTVAALLHDIGRKDGSDEDHFETGDMVREILEGRASQEFVDRVARCIACHSSSSIIDPELPEERTLFDADKLDGYGYTGIARFFAFSGENGNNIRDSLEDAIKRMEKLEKKGAFMTPMGKRKGSIRAFRAFSFYYSLAKENGLEDECRRIRKILFLSQGKLKGTAAMLLIRLLYW